MSQYTLDLPALIGSRICHDLINPIGAISNGLELLELSGHAQGPELDLICDSAGNAGARIRFFRISYGAAGDQLLGQAEVVGILKDLAEVSRFKVDWSPTDSLPRSQLRLAFLALQCFETAMPYGGTVQVHCDAGRWTLTASCDKLAYDAALWTRLDGTPSDTPVTPAQVQFALLPLAAQDLGRSVHTQSNATSITMRF